MRGAERQLLKFECSGIDCLKCYTDKTKLFDLASFLNPFWEVVMSLLQRLLEVPLPLDLIHNLLGLPLPSIEKLLNKLVSFY